TLTHGDGFGARVTVPGLGLILGHGLSRFDPRRGHPNAPGPGKRPLHNMCPTVVLEGARPVLALGAVGGRKIPGAGFRGLAQDVGLGRSLKEAVAAPRLHTQGGLDVLAEPGWPESALAPLRKAGYRVKRGPAAVVSAAGVEPGTRATWGVSR